MSHGTLLIITIGCLQLNPIPSPYHCCTAPSTVQQPPYRSRREQHGTAAAQPRRNGGRMELGHAGGRSVLALHLWCFCGACRNEDGEGGVLPPG